MTSRVLHAIIVLVAISLATAAPAATPDPPLIAAIRGPLPFDQTRPFYELVLRTPDVDGPRDSQGRTALHFSTERGFDDMSALLLNRGADPDAVDQRGYTPLFTAASHGRTWILLHLLLRGADVNHTAPDGTTALSLAVKKGDLRHTEMLLWTGATPTQSLANAAPTAEIKTLLESYLETPTLPDPTERRVPSFVLVPLHEAARRGDFPALEALTISTAGIDIRDAKGRTPIFDAIGAAQPEVVFYLLALGADPNALDNEGRSPLGATMGWLGGGLDDMRHFLIAKGANVNAVRKDGHSELTWAIKRDNEHGTQLLLYAGVDPLQTSAHGTPFELAVNEGNQRIIDLLRRNGVDGEVRLKDDPTWLIINGARRGDIEIIDEALAAGADPNTLDPRGDPALTVAIFKRNVPAARHLIAAGADIDLPSQHDGRTPLYATTVWDYHEMTLFRQELIDAGANPNARHTKDGRTMLQNSLGHRLGITQKQLIEAGVDLNARDKKGKTALTLALDDNKTETAAALRALGAIE